MLVKNRSRFLLFLLFVVGGLLLVQPPTTEAAGTTYKIECGPGPDYVGPVDQLIQAIHDANANPGLDTIAFTTNSQPCYFTLHTAVAFTNWGDAVGLPIITDDLAINGNGATIQRYTPNDDVSASFRLLHVEGEHYLRMGNVILKNGYSSDGAAVHIAKGDLELINVLVRDNRTQGVTWRSIGGAITVRNATMHNVRFNNNYSDWRGGAIYVKDGHLDLTGGHFFDNTSRHQGGAIRVYGSATIKESEFVRNSSYHGGAISAEVKGAVDISRSTFIDNSGSALTVLFFDDGDTASIVNNLWLRNRAHNDDSTWRARDITVMRLDHPYVEPPPGRVDIWHNTFVGSGQSDDINTPAVGTRNLSDHLGDSVKFYNNVLVNYPIGLRGGDDPTLESAHNLYHDVVTPEQDVLDSYGHIFAPPAFVDAARDNYRLTSVSPAVDSGLDLPVTMDLLGVPRPQGAALDLGAYEYDGTTP